MDWHARSPGIATTNQDPAPPGGVIHLDDNAATRPAQPSLAGHSPRLPLSAENTSNHLPVYIAQPEIAPAVAISELLMVDTE